MQVDAPALIGILLIFIQFLLGWLVKGLYGDIKSLKERDLHMSDKMEQLALSIPTGYVAKADFKTLGDAIFDSLRRIEDKLDKKVDKP